MRVMLVLLMLASSAHGAGFIAGQFLNIDSTNPGFYETQTLVYALPDMRLIARANVPGDATSVSVDGKRLYVINLYTDRIATLELPTLRPISDVPVQGGLPFFYNPVWVREHPHRPGVLLLRGTYWIDTRSGQYVETPESLGVVPHGSLWSQVVTISQGGGKLLVTDLGGNFNQPP